MTTIALSALAIAPAVASAATNKSAVGFFGATGAEAGQFNTPRGVAVNQASGNVYTTDVLNNRVVVFNASGTFLRTFGQDVIASGPDNNGTGYEICVPASGDVCKAGISTTATGGVMSNPQGIAVSQSSGDLYVTDGNAHLRVQQFDANGNFLRASGQDVVASGPGNAPATSAVQSLTVTATAGKYTLSFGGKTTPELAFDATPAQVQTALVALTSIGAGNIEVTGASFPYTITFKGALANNPEPTIAAASGVGPGNELEGGIVSVVSAVTGSSGYEVCVAANGDVCQKGVTASTGGAFKSGTFNGYLAVAPAGAPNAGNVLVADPANFRVQEFTASGAFVRTFGFNVVAAGPGNTGANFEVCSAADGDACKIGVTGAGSGQFVNTINRVAEDAAGNIYTVESGTPNFRVQKFTLPGNVVTPAGVFNEANLKGTAATNGPLDVAIDPATQNVLVTKAFAAGATPSCPVTGAASVAERRVVEVSPAGALEATHMACAGINVANGLAIRTSSSTGDVYVSSTTGESRLYVLNTPLTPPSVGFSGVSDISAHGATVSGFVNPNGPALSYGLLTGYHVNYKRVSDAGFSPAPPADVTVGKGTTNVFVSQKLVGLEANTTYEVQIVAARPVGGGTAVTSTFSFTTPASAPEITIPTATTGDPTGTKASLYGFVNPNSQATTYRFEYGTTASYGTSVPVPDGSAGAGGASISVGRQLTGLQPGTTYHFRLRANNPTGGAVSPDQTFTTSSPAQIGPPNRAFELVSPADKRPSGSVYTLIKTTLNFQGADDGQSIGYTIQSGLADATAGGEVIYVARRGPDGWSSKQASPPSLVPSPAGTQPSHVNYFNSDITCGFVQTPSPLTADVPQVSRDNHVGNIFRRNDDGSFTLVTNIAPSNPTRPTVLGDYYLIGGASPSCDRVYFASAGVQGEGYQLIPGASGLYEWHDGVLKDAGIRPDGSVAPTLGGFEVAPRLGGESGSPSATRFNSVSDDARRVFFTSTSNEGADSGKQAVFMREDGETIDVSKPATSTPSFGARYEVASADGTHVFFMANLGLAGSAGVGPQENCATGGEIGGTTACDIYDYDIESGDLTDLTTDTNPMDVKGAVAQGILGVSDDGSHVYFAAKGQLIPGRGKTYAENIGATKGANVYLSHNGQLHYVANVLDVDLNGSSLGGYQGGAALVRMMSKWSAWVTPSGRHLLFESRGNIAGYENGQKAEAYLYSADSANLTCISCRSNGQLPTNPPEDFSEVLPGPVTSATSVTLQYRRPMSDDGRRIFFTSRDALAPGATEGKKNIYQWEEGKLSLLATVGENEELVDSSSTGGDVFFNTSEHLSPYDFDTQPDLYDARVGGGFPPPAVPATPCTPALDQCQGAPVPAPGLGGTSSEAVVGPGNPAPHWPKKKHQKKKHQKKKHQKRKHQKKAAGRHNQARGGNDNRGGAK